MGIESNKAGSGEARSGTLITANKTEAGWYFDIISRTSWANYGEYLSIYGEELTLEELPLPRAQFQRQLPAAVRLKLHMGAA